MKDCLFCQTHKIKQDILWESENFFVKVGVGILAPGHVMIISKRHLSCFAELFPQFVEEFLSIKKTLHRKIKQNFSEPIIYEHGVYGQTVSHAHINFVPSKNEYYELESIKEFFVKISVR